jgi:hypothetical protein
MLLLSWVRSCARRKLPNPDLLASKRCFLGGTDTSGGLETLRQLSGLLTDGGRRKKREIDFASRNISAFVPAWSTVFRESSIELGSVAPSSVVNPADAVQIIGGRPVIGSERIRRHARRKVREPRPPQRSISIPISRHKCLHSSAGNSSFRSAQYLQVVNVLVAPRHLASVTPLLLRGAGAFAWIASG